MAINQPKLSYLLAPGAIGGPYQDLHTDCPLRNRRREHRHNALELCCWRWDEAQVEWPRLAIDAFERRTAVAEANPVRMSQPSARHANLR